MIHRIAKHLCSLERISVNSCYCALYLGRWTASEHDIFLEGLQRYGNDWKQIANMV